MLTLFRRWLVVLAFLLVTGRAHALDAYGILEFSAPESWDATTLERSTEFVATDADTGGFGKIRVWGPAVSTGSPSRDFKDDYDTIVARALRPTKAPKTTTTSLGSGWTRTEARVPFTFGGRNGHAVLLSFSNGAQSTVALAMFTDRAFKEAVDAFLASTHLAASQLVEASTETTSPRGDVVSGGEVPADASEGRRPDARLLGRWNRSGSFSPHYADPASWGSSGYTTCRYEFRPDGTYVYTERSWRAAHTKIILVKERGTYAADDQTITVQPSESVIESYLKKNGVDELGARVESKARPLERVRYRYAFHFFEGLQLWSLVLQADAPTLRDGPFSGNTTFANAWYFDQRFIEKDLTAPRGK